MGKHSKQGFTIIETMLVLAITGVMISALLVGIGGTINVQRYKDSVTSFKATLQNQYTLVTNVTNVSNRSAQWACSPSAVTVEADKIGIAPGQSDCVLLGRYVSVVNDKITTAAVVGYQNSTTNQATDIAAITKNYSLGISASSIETSTLEWGAQIAWPVSGVDQIPSGTLSPVPPNRAIGILIVRSPVSGTVYTFTTDAVKDTAATTSTDLTSMMIIGSVVPGQQQRYLCIDPSAGSTGLTVPEKLAVTIDQAASDSSGIETRSDAVNRTLETTVKNGNYTKCQ